MIISPIIPIWLMVIICIGLIIFALTSKKINWIEIIIIILMFIINLRFMIPSEESKFLSNDLDVLFVIDNTISMRAEDYSSSKTRLEGVKEDCKYIIRELNGARFSIITFNHKARIITPFTTDANMTIEAIDVLDTIDESYAKGSSLNTPIEEILITLKNAEKKEKRTRVIFFISDGEITDNSTLKSYKEINKHVSNGAVLGYGTTSGGYMKTKDKYTETETYLKDYSSSSGNALSIIDEKNLQQIANDINVDYIHMTSQDKIHNKIKEIKRVLTSQMDETTKMTYSDTYYIFVFPLLILLIADLCIFRRKS